MFTALNDLIKVYVFNWIKALGDEQGDWFFSKEARWILFLKVERKFKNRKFVYFVSSSDSIKQTSQFQGDYMGKCYDSVFFLDTRYLLLFHVFFHFIFKVKLWKFFLINLKW